MKKLNHLWWVGALALVVACDPYKSPNTGTPAIQSVIVSGGTPADVATSNVEATPPSTPDGAWTVETTSTCVASTKVATVPVTNRVVPTEFIIFIKSNKLLDGASIQQSASSCVPAATLFTSVTRTESGGTAADDAAFWYACYAPAGALESEGGSVVLYRSAERTAASPNPGDVTLDGGWFAMSNEATGAKEDFTPYVTGSPKNVVTYAFLGSAKDEQGHPLPFNIEYSIAPDAGAVTFDLTIPTSTFDFADGSGPDTIPDPILGTSTAISATGTSPTTADVKFDFAEGDCNPAAGATYRLERSPHGAKDFTKLADLAAADTGYTDVGVKYGDSFDYQVVESITPTGAAKALETVKGKRTVTALLSPAAPTLDSTTSSVTVTWAAVPGATSYTVERNVSDEKTYTKPVPGTVWTAVGDAADTTLTDSGRPSATPYWYRVTANGANGSSEPGPAVRVVTK